MKLQLLLPPIAAVIAGGVWLGYAAAARSQLAADNSGLRERIGEARAGKVGGAGHSAAERQARSGSKPFSGKLSAAEFAEWRGLADAMLQAKEGGMTDLRLILRMQSRLKKLTAAEILATFDELAASDLSSEAVAALQGMFLDAAAEQDPQLTLERFADLLGEGDHPLRGNLARAFGRWLDKDAAAASVWLDEMSAAGQFETKRLDGRNQLLLDCVGPVIARLLDADPAASLDHLLALPEGQRLEVLNRHATSLKPGTEAAFAELIRKGLPEEQQGSGFRDVTDRLAVKQGIAKVGEFLDTIGATPEERQAVAGTAATRGLGELLGRNGTADELYTWLARQSPETADWNAGTALGTNVESAGFEKMSAMVAELHARTGSDQLLAAFLTRKVMTDHPAEARDIAAQIENPALRAAIIGQIVPPQVYPGP